MAYERNDFRSRDDRWRDRGRDYYGRGNDDRGFFDRAGDEVRSWFGDDEAERRREADARRYERERGQDNWRGDYDRNTAGSWGNQRAWSDDRFGGGNRDYDDSGRGGYGSPDTWEGSGFGGPYGLSRRFDRIDVGSTGTHGAHPMSAPAGTYYGGDYGGIGPSGELGRSSAARYAEVTGNRGDAHDRHYSEWRRQQIANLDNDYEDYRREHQSKFDSEFGSWRDRRQGQRASLRQVTEHMEVVGSDGQHVGTVDHVRGDHIILTRNDPDAGGRHHSIPCSWIDTVVDKVTIGKTADEAQREWQEADRNRALFERPDQGSDGPRTLNRSFSGTYDDKR